MEILVEPGLQPRVGVDEPGHQGGVPRHDDHEIVPVVLHGLEDGVDGLLAEVLVRPLGGQGVGLVNEQHAPQGLFDDLLGLDGGLAHVPRHQPAAVHLHQVALGEQPQGGVDLPHDPGHGGLAGAGVAGEHQVEGHVRALHAPLTPQSPDLHQVHQALHVLLHHLQAHQLVELRHGLLQRGPGRGLLPLGLLRGGGGGGRRLFLCGRGPLRHRQGVQGAPGRGLPAEKVAVQAPGPVPREDPVKLVHQVVELPGGVPLRPAAQGQLRPGSRSAGGQGRDPGAVTGGGEQVVEPADPLALAEGEGTVVGGAEHQQILLNLRKGAAVGGAVGRVPGGQPLEKLRHAHVVGGVGTVVADSLVELLGGEFDLPVGVDLVDADDVPAPASTGRPQAQGAGPEVGVHLLAAHPRLRRHALAEAADGVGVIPVEIFAHGLLFSAAAKRSLPRHGMKCRSPVYHSPAGKERECFSFGRAYFRKIHTVALDGTGHRR